MDHDSGPNTDNAMGRQTGGSDAKFCYNFMSIRLSFRKNPKEPCRKWRARTIEGANFGFHTDRQPNQRRLMEGDAHNDVARIGQDEDRSAGGEDVPRLVEAAQDDGVPRRAELLIVGPVGFDGGRDLGEPNLGAVAARLGNERGKCRFCTRNTILFGIERRRCKGPRGDEPGNPVTVPAGLRERVLGATKLGGRPAAGRLGNLERRRRDAGATVLLVALGPGEDGVTLHDRADVGAYGKKTAAAGEADGHGRARFKGAYAA